jgi:small GTP-binding protein
MGLLDLLKNFKKTGVDVSKILILGLDNAGKTTILRSLSQEEMQVAEPTKGFNVKTVINKDFRLNVWDLGGQQEIRKYWQHFYKDCNGIVIRCLINIRFMLLIHLMIREC